MPGKKVYLEWLRVIAVVLVIFNHLPGYALFMSEEGAARGIHMFLSMLTRVNVPLFLMISGALLLPREESLRTVLTRRVLRILAVLVLFSLALFGTHCLYYTAIKHQAYDVSLSNFFYRLLSRTVEGSASYWYLYAFLAYLCMLPLLQRAARRMTGGEFALLAGLHAAYYTLLPLVNLVFMALGWPVIHLNRDFAVPFATTAAFFYPLAGYWLDQKVDVSRMRPAKAALVGLAGLAAVAAACLCTRWYAAMGHPYTQDYVNMFDYAAAFAVFVCVKWLTAVRWPALSRGRTARVICFWGSLTFGIYLLDPFLKVALWGPFSRAVGAAIPEPGVSWLWCVLSMLLGGALTLGLKRVPGLRRLL